jgi:hypothetical protein
MNLSRFLFISFIYNSRTVRLTCFSNHRILQLTYTCHSHTINAFTRLAHHGGGGGGGGRKRYLLYAVILQNCFFFFFFFFAEFNDIRAKFTPNVCETHNPRHRRAQSTSISGSLLQEHIRQLVFFFLLIELICVFFPFSNVCGASLILTGQSLLLTSFANIFSFQNYKVSLNALSNSRISDNHSPNSLWACWRSSRVLELIQC